MRYATILMACLLFCSYLHPLYAQTNTFPDDGNVGIGTASPAEKLDIVSNNFTGVVLKRRGTGGGIAINMINAVADGNWQFGVGANAHFGIYKDGFALGSQFIITKEENVGIGTLSPRAKLSVNGTAKAKEVIVIAQASDWPDYVFKEEYELSDLTEIEAYIQKHEHLPGIPTKKKVSEEGQNLGSIQAKLLEKVEELTLHMIDLKKENNALVKRIEQLERTIDK